MLVLKACLGPVLGRNRSDLLCPLIIKLCTVLKCIFLPLLPLSPPFRAKNISLLYIAYSQQRCGRSGNPTLAPSCQETCRLKFTEYVQKGSFQAYASVTGLAMAQATRDMPSWPPYRVQSNSSIRSYYQFTYTPT